MNLKIETDPSFLSQYRDAYCRRNIHDTRHRIIHIILTHRAFLFVMCVLRVYNILLHIHHMHHPPYHATDARTAVLANDPNPSKTKQPATTTDDDDPDDDNGLVGGTSNTGSDASG
mmetsp:Transcript_1096/g.1584  ORF Transcript_1096/g.1584 Transcript_1096/m.1584 type:complete len:116 (-) Transcript_1096:57-404(-)